MRLLNFQICIESSFVMTTESKLGTVSISGYLHDVKNKKMKKMIKLFTIKL